MQHAESTKTEEIGDILGEMWASISIESTIATPVFKVTILPRTTQILS